MIKGKKRKKINKNLGRLDILRLQVWCELINADGGSLFKLSQLCPPNITSIGRRVLESKKCIKN